VRRFTGDITVSVKSTITKRLKNTDLRNEEDEEVSEYVSCASRFGSYLINLHYMRPARGGKRNASRWCCNFIFVTNAMDFVRLDNPPAKACNAQGTYKPTPMIYPTSKYLASQACRTPSKRCHISSTMNSIHQHGSNRLAGLVKAALILEYLHKGYGETDRYGCRIGLRLSRIKRLPESIKQLIYKYRKTSPRASTGSLVHQRHQKTTRQHKFHRVLEIYWEIENDMDGLALRARTAGWTVNVTEDDHEEGLDEHDIGRVRR
jgi:hypothetical protein